MIWINGRIFSMIRWGILGAGKIAYRFAESLLNEPDSVLTAIAVRKEEKALEFRKQFVFDRYYLDYQKLLEDREIDAIYLSLPHGLHKEWAIKALNCGKPVLCEKPAALNAEEMREIKDAARKNDVLFMEAMKPRFTPMYEYIRNFITQGEIGEIVSIDTQICFSLLSYGMENIWGKTYHTQKGQGGCLLDSGTYCASWIIDYLKKPLSVLKTYVNVYDDIDIYVDSRLSDGKTTARMELGFDRNKPRDAIITGTKGSIHIYDLHRPEKIDIIRNDKTETVELPCVNDDFYGEIHHFTELMKQGIKESPIMSLDDSIRCMQVLDEIRNSFTEYDETDLEILQEHEKILQYESFSSKDALVLGNRIVSLLSDYDNGIALQIQRNSDNAIIYQYISDDKSDKNIAYIKMKRKVTELTGHSSMYPLIEYKATGQMSAQMSVEDGFMPCAGSFPIRVKDETVGTVTVSGLHEGKDYEIVVRALSQILNKEIPDFYKATY